MNLKLSHSHSSFRVSLKEANCKRLSSGPFGFQGSLSCPVLVSIVDGHISSLGFLFGEGRGGVGKGDGQVPQDSEPGAAAVDVQQRGQQLPAKALQLLLLHLSSQLAGAEVVGFAVQTEPELGSVDVPLVHLLHVGDSEPALLPVHIQFVNSLLDQHK
jgi:hypothetical protein